MSRRNDKYEYPSASVNSNLNLPQPYALQHANNDHHVMGSYENTGNHHNNNNNNNNNSDADDYTDEYVDIHTARRNQYYPNETGTGAGDGTLQGWYANAEDHETVLTAAQINNNSNPYNYNDAMNRSDDATMAVHEMHLTLLYMMSHPDEFEKCVLQSSSSSPRNSATPHSRNPYHHHSAADDLSLATETTDFSIQQPLSQQQQQAVGNHHTNNNNNNNTLTSIIEDGISNIMSSKPKDTNDVLLPYLIFCEDAEIVLPQAHTASQLFGIELVTGIELEAASGIVPICQLFLRWLALMPQGDHLHILNPPGLTVMRITGGRYRVTAAHTVVWTWMNEFVLPIPPPSSPHYSTLSSSSSMTMTTTPSLLDPTTKPGTGTGTNNTGGNNNNTHSLQMGDLVGMTIVDVFESDHSGKLLSYCPTFDNRNIYKIDRTTYQIKKHTTTAMKSVIQKVIQTSQIANKISQYTSHLASQVHQRVTHAVQNYQTTTHPSSSSLSASSPPKGRSNILNPAVTALDDDEHHGEAGNDEQDEENDDEDEAVMTAPSAPTSPHRTASKITSESTSMYHGDDDNERHEV